MQSKNHRFQAADQADWNGATARLRVRITVPVADRHRWKKALAPAGPGARPRGRGSQVALKTACRRSMPEIAGSAPDGRRRGVRMLWDVCQVPDFRKTMSTGGTRLIVGYRFTAFLTGTIGHCNTLEDWFAGQIARGWTALTAISMRCRNALAFTSARWTYAANRARTGSRTADHWRGRDPGRSRTACRTRCMRG